MTFIALEEAFSIPGPDADKPPWAGNVHRTKADVMKDWARRLADFTEYRLPDMDEHGIDIQVLSLTVPGIQVYSDVREAVTQAQAANDYLAEVVANKPERFRGFAALPLQDPDAAIRELRRCVNELGFVGALVNDHTNSTYLDDPAYDLLWSELEALDVPLYIHPSILANDHWDVMEGHPELRGSMWSFTVTVSGHVLRILFSGVFDRHPNARLIVGHMGELLPFATSRMDSRYAAQTPLWPLERMPSEYFGSNILITTSGVVSPAVLEGVVLAMGGADAVMFSVDYPYESTAAAVAGFEAARLSDTDREKIAHLNARRILKL